MADKNKYGKDTDRDVKPARGQESNENWDDTGEQAPDTKASHTGEDARTVDNSAPAQGIE